MDKIGLDNLSQNYNDEYNPDVSVLLNMLDGDVYSQNIKISHRDWLDMGYEGWSKTPDDLKAAAYQAATEIGKWDDVRLKHLMLKCYPHLKDSVLDLTLDTLKAISQKTPIEIVVLSNTDVDVQIRSKTQQ